MADEKQAEIEAGARVTAFLADPAVQAAFARAEKQAMDDIRSSETDDQMRAARAVLKAIDALQTQLRVTVDRGARTRVEVERAERGAPRKNR
jgi:hypothetical protein